MRNSKIVILKPNCLLFFDDIHPIETRPVKFDINKKLTGEAEHFFSANNLPVYGKIPYTKQITETKSAEKNLIEYDSNGKASIEIEKARVNITADILPHHHHSPD